MNAIFQHRRDQEEPFLILKNASSDRKRTYFLGERDEQVVYRHDGPCVDGIVRSAEQSAGTRQQHSWHRRAALHAPGPVPKE